MERDAPGDDSITILSLISLLFKSLYCKKKDPNTRKLYGGLSEVSLPLILKLLTNIEMGKHTNPRAVKSSFKSFRDVPLSATEIKEIEDIQAKQYWQRGPLKDQFCDRNNRLISEVNAYFKEHPRVPDNLVPRKTANKELVKKTDSLPAPKEQVTEIPTEKSQAHLASDLEGRIKGEVRVKYKSIRIEGGELVFEV